MKKILIACEESQSVCKAFRKLGVEAYSCDIQPCSGGRPDWHFQEDVFKVIAGEAWSAMIAFPPCTRLTNSVWWYIKRHGLQDEAEAACHFFNALLGASIDKIVIENPVQHGLARQFIRKYDQTIQPHEYGEDASKKTCLWLKNLPPLIPTKKISPRLVCCGKVLTSFICPYCNGSSDPRPRWKNQTDGGWNKLPPSKDRGKIRSKTYQGIAEAMAKQWSQLL